MTGGECLNAGNAPMIGSNDFYEFTQKMFLAM